jgi:hypothetical protein
MNLLKDFANSITKLAVMLTIVAMFFGGCDPEDNLTGNGNDDDNIATSIYGHPKKIIIKFEDGIYSYHNKKMVTDEEFGEELFWAFPTDVLNYQLQSAEELTMTFVKDVDSANAVYQMVIPTYDFAGGYNWNKYDDWWGPLLHKYEVRVIADRFIVEGEYRIKKLEDGTVNISSTTSTSHMKSTAGKIIPQQRNQITTSTTSEKIVKETDSKLNVSMSDIQIIVSLIDGKSYVGFAFSIASYSYLTISFDRDKKNGQMIRTEGEGKLDMKNPKGICYGPYAITCHW